MFYGVVLTSISEASIIQWHNYWKSKENVDIMIIAIFRRLVKEESSVSV